ncbi:MAG: hypothetical protein KIS92_16100, partial [Planctomycetota bacterium]|nr:hypothetical protein [Planctomycetota bacterium]
MPSVLAKSPTLRCPRCATVLRNRSLCPSCGRDLEQEGSKEPAAPPPHSQQPAVTAPIEAQPASPEPLPAAPRVPPKPSLTLCAMCLASVPAAEIQTRDGKPVCSACAQVMNKPAAPAPVLSAPVPAEVAARPAPARRPSPPAPRAATSEPPQEELKFNRYHEEQLKKKLGWVKLVLLIGGVVLALTGGGTWLLGDL